MKKGIAKKSPYTFCDCPKFVFFAKKCQKFVLLKTEAQIHQLIFPQVVGMNCFKWSASLKTFGSFLPHFPRQRAIFGIFWIVPFSWKNFDNLSYTVPLSLKNIEKFMYTVPLNLKKSYIFYTLSDDEFWQIYLPFQLKG